MTDWQVAKLADYDALVRGVIFLCAAEIAAKALARGVSRDDINSGLAELVPTMNAMRDEAYREMQCILGE